MTSIGENALWVVIPAAGRGERMQCELPKQYLELAGIAILQRTIDAMLCIDCVVEIIVAIAEDDNLWQQLPASKYPQVSTVTGGSTRAESVSCALESVCKRGGLDCWVLVHDAARPLAAITDVQRLIQAVVHSESVGGLLAVPVQDTLKQAGATQQSMRTVPRESLWQAQTPQIYRAGLLSDVLQQASADVVTDEASALEMQGYHPVLVEALEPNLKITRPGDIMIAEALLAQRTS